MDHVLYMIMHSVEETHQRKLWNIILQDINVFFLYSFHMKMFNFLSIHYHDTVENTRNFLP